MEVKRENYVERMRYECKKKHKNWLQRHRIDVVLQVIVIFGSASLPVLLNVHQVPVLIPTILSISITACAATSKYFKFEEWGRIHNLSYLKLSSEIDDYDYKTGKYKGMSDDDAFDYFKSRTSLILDEHMKLVNTLHKEPPSDQSTESQSDQQFANNLKS
jgi:hypothetical protein